LPGAPPATQRRVQRDFVHLLADLHRLDFDALGLGDLTPEAERGLTHDLRRARDYAAWAADGDLPPALTDALDWCGEHRPDPEPPPALLWGDARLGNIVYSSGSGGSGDLTPAAVLDWEMASIGPGETDLAWFLGLHDLAVGHNGTDLPGFAGHDDVIGEYAARLDRDVRDYRWFEVFGLIRSDSIFLRIRRMLLAAGLDEPWLRGATPGQRRIDELIGST
jgi:aminoglycoside phosphotransferase (APT) family kinase protein